MDCILFNGLFSRIPFIPYVGFTQYIVPLGRIMSIYIYNKIDYFLFSFFTRLTVQMSQPWQISTLPRKTFLMVSISSLFLN
jgi:hypothetical protein